MKKIIVLLVFLLSFQNSVAFSQETQEGIGARTINLQPFFVSIFDGRQIRGRATIEIIIEVKDQKDSAEIKTKLPQIRSDFTVALSRLSKDRFTINRPIDPDLIRFYLMTYASHRLGPDKIEVYVQQAFIQPNAQ